jgi:hypothetical protein
MATITTPDRAFDTLYGLVQDGPRRPVCHYEAFGKTYRGEGENSDPHVADGQQYVVSFVVPAQVGRDMDITNLVQATGTLLVASVNEVADGDGQLVLFLEINWAGEDGTLCRSTARYIVTHGNTGITIVPSWEHYVGRQPAEGDSAAARAYLERLVYLAEVITWLGAQPGPKILVMLGDNLRKVAGAEELVPIAEWASVQPGIIVF